MEEVSSLAGQNVDLQQSQTECKNTPGLVKQPHPICSESSTPITNKAQVPDGIVIAECNKNTNDQSDKNMVDHVFDIFQ